MRAEWGASSQKAAAFGFRDRFGWGEKNQPKLTRDLPWVVFDIFWLLRGRSTFRPEFDWICFYEHREGFLVLRLPVKANPVPLGLWHNRELSYRIQTWAKSDHSRPKCLLLSF